MAATLDRELAHWLPFTQPYVQYEVLANAPISVIDDFEKRRVRYNKPTRVIGLDGKPIMEIGYMPIIKPEVAQCIRDERGEGEVIWDVKVRKRKKYS